MPTSSTGSANGKIILMGEHAVVYQEPAIALPFTSVEVTATITERKGPLAIQSAYFEGFLQNVPDHLENIKAVIEHSLKRLGQPLKDLHIIIKSTIPEERGMGSSAAVATALVRGLFDHYQKPLDQEELLDLIDIGEKIAHGNPSGLDALTTSSDLPVYFIRDQVLENFDLNLSSYLVVADTGIRGQTRQAVDAVAQLLKEERKQTRQILKEIGQLVNQAKDALRSESSQLLGQLMNQNHELLTRLSVSSKELDDYVAIARQAGALGAKLTGGGRGGCLIALADSQTLAQDIQAQLEDAGCSATWNFLLETGEKINA